MDKWVHLHTVEYYAAMNKSEAVTWAATWMGLGDTVLRDRSWRANCTIPFAETVKNREMHKDTPWIRGCRGWRRGGGWLFVGTGLRLER